MLWAFRPIDLLVQLLIAQNCSFSGVTKKKLYEHRRRIHQESSVRMGKNVTVVAASGETDADVEGIQDILVAPIAQTVAVHQPPVMGHEVFGILPSSSSTASASLSVPVTATVIASATHDGGEVTLLPAAQTLTMGPTVASGSTQGGSVMVIVESDPSEAQLDTQQQKRYVLWPVMPDFLKPNHLADFSQKIARI